MAARLPGFDRVPGGAGEDEDEEEAERDRAADLEETAPFAPVVAQLGIEEEVVRQSMKEEG